MRAIHLRTVTPTPADLQNMHDTTDNFPIAPRFHAAPVHRDKRLQRRPLPVAQPEFVGHSSAPSTKELESDPPASGQENNRVPSLRPPAFPLDFTQIINIIMLSLVSAARYWQRCDSRQIECLLLHQRPPMSPRSGIKRIDRDDDRIGCHQPDGFAAAVQVDCGGEPVAGFQRPDFFSASATSLGI